MNKKIIYKYRYTNFAIYTLQIYATRLYYKFILQIYTTNSYTKIYTDTVCKYGSEVKIGFNTCSVIVKLEAKWRDATISSNFWLPGFQTVLKREEGTFRKPPTLDAYKAFKNMFKAIRSKVFNTRITNHITVGL